MQAIRDEMDMSSMICPEKYRVYGDFIDYYEKRKRAPLLTVFIGGNHEASTHLWELYPLVFTL